MKISDEIKEIIRKQTSDGVLTVQDFVSYFGTRSIAFIVVLLSLPIALPFTPPGLNTPFAIVCVILSVNYILNKKELKLPKFVVDRKIPFKPDGKFFGAMDKMLRTIELAIKPRFNWATESRFSKLFLGLGMLSASIIMIIPLPIINSLSSLLVLLTAVSIVAKDGLIASFASIISILLLAFSIGIIIYGIVFGINFLKP